jgi:two-component system, response regulator YesN
MESKKKAKSVLFKRFLLSYFVILLIPLLFAAFAYNAATKVVEENAIESRLTMLRQTRDIIDKHLKEIDEMMIQVAINSKLSSLLSLKDPEEGSPEIFKLWDYAREIKTHTVTTNVFKSTFFIFLKNSNFIFTHDDTYYDFNAFYKNVLNYANLNFDQWNNIYFKDYNFKKVLACQGVNVNGNSISAITYLCSLPWVTGSKPQGVIAFLIEEQEITKMLSSQIFYDSGAVNILDSDGEVIFQTSNNKNIIDTTNFGVNGLDGYTHKNINGQDFLLVYTSSNYSGWSYTAVLPKNAVAAKVLYIKKLALGVAGVSLLLGFLVSLFWAYTNTKPFKEVLLTLRDFINNDSKIKLENNLNEYDYLKGGILHLINGTRDMQESLNRQYAEMKTLLIDRLLKGEFNDKSKMSTLLEHVGLDIKGEKFIVVIIKLVRNPVINTGMLDELEFIRVRFESIIKKSLKNRGYLHLINEGEIAILLNFTEECTEFIISFVNEIVNNIYNEMYDIYHICLEFSVGEIYDDLYDIHFSYREALHALDSFGDNSNHGHVVWYKDIVKDYTSYYYPMDLELKLSNLAKAGNWLDIENILEKIYLENFKKRRISKSLEKYLLNNMKATIIKLLGEIQSVVDIRSLEYKSSDRNDVLAMLNEIKEIYHKICVSIESTRKRHNNRLTDDIVKYIKSNFTDPNLSVYDISTKFSLSESYFSQFFKEQTGEYFKNYLENMRIKYACELIEEGSLSIDSISLKVGYNSSNSFRRAFRRTTGKAPSQYI